MNQSCFREKGYNFLRSDSNVGMVVISKGDKTYYAEHIDLEQRNKQNTLDRYAVLKQINHKNIVRVAELLEFPSFCYLLYEYVEGKALSKLENPQYTEKQLAEIASQIMEGLSELHRYKVVHTILNGDSIIRTDDGHYKIFKLSYSFSGKDSNISVIQSSIVIYPPEFDPKDPTSVGPHFDVWSFGLLIYKLHTKKDVFPTAKALDSYLKSMELVKYDATDNLRNFIQNCLNPNPHLRISVPELLSHQFITANTATTRSSDSKGSAPNTFPSKTNINDPLYIESINNRYKEMKSKIESETISHRKSQEPQLNKLINQLDTVERESISIKQKIDSIKLYRLVPENEPMTDAECDYFNRLTKLIVFQGRAVVSALLQPTQRIILNIDPKNPVKYDWNIIAKCFQKLRAAVMKSNSGFILAIPKDYIFDLDEFEDLALPLMKDTLNMDRTEEQLITIEFYAFLSDEQVDNVTKILGSCNFSLKFKKDRISFFSQLNIASYRSSNPDDCRCVLDVF